MTLHEDMKPSKEDALILMADGATGGYGLDTIRLMKGAFLVSQLGPPEWRDLFDFRPYHYGPFDSSIYPVRNRLCADGLFERHGSGRYATYTLTEAGHARAQVWAKQSERFTDWMRQIGRWVSSRSFSDLLDDIYDRYPDFASESVHVR